MGFDKTRFHKQRTRKQSESTNVYMKLLIQLYTFLARRTDSKVNKTILKRLKQTRQFQRPMSYARIGMFMRTNNRIADKKIAVLVGTVVDDTRNMEPVQGLRVCALRFTKSARERITARGGECITFEELARIAPTGNNVVLFRGSRRTETKKHFGRPGQPGSHAKPHVKKVGGRKVKERNPGLTKTSR